MKKSTLFLACCIGLMLFASCKKDPIAPTINLLDDVGCVTENAQVYSGNEIVVGFTLTGQKLTQIEVVISKDGVVLAQKTDNLGEQKADPVSTYQYWSSFVVEANGTVNIKGTVTDANGLTASKSFNIIYNEKPNAKFVGRYSGSPFFNGTMHAEIQDIGPFDQDIENEETPTVLVLEPGEEIDEVVGTCTFEDRTFVCRGTVEGDVVTFEGDNETYDLSEDFNGMTINVPLTITYCIKGTLSNGQLILNGTCKGNGEFNVLMYSGTLEIDASLSGSLIKE